MKEITRKHAILSDIDLSLLPATSTNIQKWQQDLMLSLEEKLDGALAMITGRGMQSVDKVFPGVAASVEQHAAWRPFRGADLQVLGKKVDINEIVEHAARELNGKVKLLEQISDIHTEKSGVFVEEKQFSIALIFTDAASREVAIEAAEAILTARPDLDGTHGMKVGSDAVEIGPQGVDKGKAVRDFMATAFFYGKTPIYIGDGPTDEDAMREVRAMGGFNVAVGHLITNDELVDLRVDTIEDMWDVLKSWEANLPPAP